MDSAYEPLSRFAPPDPPGTELEVVDGYEVMLLDRSAWGLTTGVCIGSVAELLGLRLGVDLRTESSHQQEKQERKTHLERKKCVVPDKKYAIQTFTTFRFDIGFKCHRTGDNGASWLSIDFRLPVEIWAWHRIYSAMKHGTSECFESMYNDVETVIAPRVRRWLSGKLEQAGLTPLRC